MDNARRFRGLVGTAITWGVALAALATGSLVLGLATGLVPSSIFGARELVAVALRGLLLGAVGGGVFGWMLSRRERGHSIGTLSARRVGLWGFVAGASLPVLATLVATGPVLPFGVLVAGVVGFGGIGSLFSTTTPRIARGAEARLEAPEEVGARLLR